MADDGIKKVKILKEDLPSIDSDNFAYNVRYRIISDDKNQSSVWSNFEKVSAAEQRVFNSLKYSYTVNNVTTSTGPGKTVSLSWEPRTSLKNIVYDLFVAREVTALTDGLTTTGSTSLTITEENANIKVGQVMVGDHLALEQIFDTVQYSGTIATTSTTTTITGIASTAGIVAGMKLVQISGTGDFGGIATVTNVNSGSIISITTDSTNVTGPITFYATQPAGLSSIVIAYTTSLVVGQRVTGAGIRGDVVIGSITQNGTAATTIGLKYLNSNYTLGSNYILISQSGNKYRFFGTHVTSIDGVTIGFYPGNTANISNNSSLEFYKDRTIYISGNSPKDRLETGGFTFYGENELTAGQIVTIFNSAVPEFNGTFKVLPQDLSSTQFRVVIYKDGPTGFEPPSGTAEAYTYPYYASTDQNSYTIEKLFQESEMIVRCQLSGYPKVSRDKLSLFQTAPIDLT